MKKIFGFIISILFVNIVYGENISLEQFLEYKKQYKQISSNIIKIDAGILKEALKNKKCFYYEKNDDIIISPLCLLTDDLPKYGFPKNIDETMKHIIGFANIYDMKSTVFEYEDANPIFDKKYVPISKTFQSDDKSLLLILAARDYNLKIPKISFLLDEIKDYNFYVADKELDNRGYCRKKNFNIAMDIVDSMILGPGESKNINEELVKHSKEYCGGSTNLYLFYGGVCGATTQIFRNALLNPYLYVDKRYPHAHRYVRYYGEYIYGDDAAVYEWQKQLEIKNIGNEKIYFKTWTYNDKKYLISVYPQKSNYYTHIMKVQKGKLNSIVKKTVLRKKDKSKRYEQVWESFYDKRTWE